MPKGHNLVPFRSLFSPFLNTRATAMLSNEIQRGSKRIAMLKMLNAFFKKLMSSPPPSSPPSFGLISRSFSNFGDAVPVEE